MPYRTVFLCLLAAGALCGQSLTELTRTVEGQTLQSMTLPSAKLRFADSFRYVGGKRFELYGLAIAELHLFVDADAQGQVKRLFWAQFEQYMPNNDRTYKYEVPGATDIGSLHFVYDTSLFTDYRGMQTRPDSDSVRMRELLAKAGLTLPQSMARIRLVNLGTDRRSELMIIYAEAIAPDRLPAGATNGMGVDDKVPEWPRSLLKAVNESLKITP